MILAAGVPRHWVHAATGAMKCEPLVAPPSFEIKQKSRWPHIEKDPEKIRHLRDIVGRLETAMMPNTKDAIIACLDELIRIQESFTPGVPASTATETKAPNG